jgi:hypothetical protein
LGDAHGAIKIALVSEKHAMMMQAGRDIEAVVSMNS